jgi:UDP-N-acetylmuramate: L-alanyl-gamma-D-glutamyl-meso-diaminopimelate ligase
MHRNIYIIGADDPLLAMLALTLHQQGCAITASIASQGSLPEKFFFSQPTIIPLQIGFLEANITNKPLDCVVVSSNIGPDNIELVAAKKIGLPIYSYFEYIQYYAHNKQRILIIGQPSAIRILSAILHHVLNYYRRPFDYAALSGLSSYLALTPYAPFILLYDALESASNSYPCKDWLDYRPHLLLFLGLDEALKQTKIDRALQNQFLMLARSLPKGGGIVYDAAFPIASDLKPSLPPDVKQVVYTMAQSRLTHDVAYVTTSQGEIAIRCANDLSSLVYAWSGAQHLLQELAISPEQFYTAMRCMNDL